MGPAAIGDAIARDLAGLSRRVKQAVREVAKDAAKVAREEHRANAAAATGGDRRFSNFKGPALDVAVKYDEAGVAIKPKGPWKIVEEGAAPHGNHPGTARTQGKGAWTRAEAATVGRLDSSVPKIYDQAIEGANRA